MAQENDDGLPFEQAFQQLEETVQALEKGGLTLDQAVALYEQGMRLAQRCAQRLDNAEMKITELQNAFLNQPPLLKEEDDSQPTAS